MGISFIVKKYAKQKQWLFLKSGCGPNVFCLWSSFSSHPHDDASFITNLEPFHEDPSKLHHKPKYM
jgi:hypothetical protein